MCLFFLSSFRFKCLACFKQYKKKEHLIEHMRVSYHSVHQPKCGVCHKQCKSLESLREHLTGKILPCIHFCTIYKLNCVLGFLFCFFIVFGYCLGNLPKKNCSKIFSEQGCNYCLKIFENADSLCEHKEICQLPVPVTVVSYSIQSSSTLYIHREIYLPASL